MTATATGYDVTAMMTTAVMVAFAPTSCDSNGTNGRRNGNDIMATLATVVMVAIGNNDR